MRPIPHEAERSIARSRNRLRILLTLSSLGEAYVGQLARATGIAHRRVLACLLGSPRTYSPRLSLVGLGLAVERKGPVGRFFEITSKGRRKARSVTASRLRRSRSRGRFA